MTTAVAMPAQKVSDQPDRSFCSGSDWMSVPPTPKLARSTTIVAAATRARRQPDDPGRKRRAANSQNTNPKAELTTVVNMMNRPFRTSESPRTRPAARTLTVATSSLTRPLVGGIEREVAERHAKVRDRLAIRHAGSSANESEE